MAAIFCSIMNSLPERGEVLIGASDEGVVVCAASADSRLAPQLAQNFAFCSTGLPHEGQFKLRATPIVPPGTFLRDI